MGAWGIRERQSDYGLDLLGTIVGTQLKAVDFAIFNTAEAIELLRQDIMEDIKRTNRGCPPEGLDCYINANFPRDFTHAALLIAECLADYYRTEELTVTEYLGKNYDPVDYHKRIVKRLGHDLLNIFSLLIQKVEYDAYDHDNKFNHRLRRDHARQAPQCIHQHNARNEQDHISEHGDDHGVDRLAQGLKIGSNDVDHADQRRGQTDYSQEGRRLCNQRPNSAKAAAKKTPSRISKEAPI